MEDQPESNGGGLLPLTADERGAMQASADDDMLRQREVVRIEVARLESRLHEAHEELRNGMMQADDHLIVPALRRVLALGLQAQPLATNLERLLPQPTRLFTP